MVTSAVEVQCREVTGAGVWMKPMGLYFSEMCRKKTVQSALWERCVCACVRACVHACMRACVCVCVDSLLWPVSLPECPRLGR